MNFSHITSANAMEEIEKMTSQLLGEPANGRRVAMKDEYRYGETPASPPKVILISARPGQLHGDSHV